MGFSSQPGRGSTFWLEIEVERAAQPAAVDVEPLDTLSGVRVLVVDDNEVNRTIAAKMLEMLGAEAATAASGSQAVEAVVADAFDLVLMDIQMPGMDGMEATRRIRALGSAASDTPILALTANVLPEQQEQYAAAGMDGVVEKPISPGALIRELAHILANPPRAGAAGAVA